MYSKRRYLQCCYVLKIDFRNEIWTASHCPKLIWSIFRIWEIAFKPEPYRLLTLILVSHDSGKYSRTLCPRLFINRQWLVAHHRKGFPHLIFTNSVHSWLSLLSLKLNKSALLIGDSVINRCRTHKSSFNLIPHTREETERERERNTDWVELLNYYDQTFIMRRLFTPS